MRRGMKKGSFFAAVVLIMVCMCLVSACGREEYVVEMGVDGYVYVPQKLGVPVKTEELKVAGDYLYYVCPGKTENSRNIERISVLPLLSGGDLDISGRETVLDTFYRYSPLPNDVAESLRENGYEGAAELTEKSCHFYVREFSVDRERNLYYYEHIYTRQDADSEPVGGILYKKGEDGEEIYHIYMEEMDDLAVDGEGRAYILSGSRIYVMDDQGRQTGSVSVEAYRDGNTIRLEELIEDSRGRVYYSVVYTNMIRRLGEVRQEGNGELRLQETENFLGNGMTRHYTAMEGNMFLYVINTEQALYEYNCSSGITSMCLSWVESGMLSAYVRSLVQISPDRLLVAYAESSRAGLYMLTRTAVDELPEKEELVLASVKPAGDLQRAVMNFNLENDRYRIIIDDYGMYYSQEEDRWITTRLDAALASSNPPDLIDMKLLNIPKYAAKGALEDLYPYLENSSILSPEDFLENVLEGMTLEGRLTCIPRGFSIVCMAGRSSQIDALDGWTAEDVYALTESHPEAGSEMITNGYGGGLDWAYLMGEFWSFYYLEKFVDWEERKCSFDSAEFGRLLEWTGKYAQEPEDSRAAPKHIYGTGYVLPSEESLLIFVPSLDFARPAILGILCGEKVSIRGFPSMEEGGRFRVYIYDAIGIVSKSGRREAAWKFLEYYLSREQSAMFRPDFSTKTALLQEELQEEITAEYMVIIDGAPAMESPMRPKQQVAIEGGEEIPYYVSAPEEAESVMRAILSADFTPLSDEKKEIISIVTEEAEYYFSGTKSIEEVTSIIQNRVQLLLEEGRK